MNREIDISKMFAIDVIRINPNERKCISINWDDLKTDLDSNNVIDVDLCSLKSLKDYSVITFTYKNNKKK